MLVKFDHGMLGELLHRRKAVFVQSSRVMKVRKLMWRLDFVNCNRSTSFSLFVVSVDSLSITLYAEEFCTANA